MRFIYSRGTKICGERGGIGEYFRRGIFPYVFFDGQSYIIMYAHKKDSGAYNGHGHCGGNDADSVHIDA